MKKMTMDDYLFQGIEALDFDGDISLNWDQESHVFEVNFKIAVANPNHLPLEWKEGDTIEPVDNQTDNGVVYADGILFFDQNRLNGQDYADDYLVTIPFAGKKGLDKATLDAFLNNLQDTLDNGESDLMDFLDVDNDQENFILKWDETQFEKYLQQQPANNKTIFYTYPKY